MNKTVIYMILFSYFLVSPSNAVLQKFQNTKQKKESKTSQDKKIYDIISVIQNNNIKEIEHIIYTHKISDYQAMRFFYEAAIAGKQDICKLIAQKLGLQIKEHDTDPCKCRDIRKRLYNCKSALINAAGNNYKKICKIILKYFPDLLKEDTLKLTLHSAALRGHGDICDTICKNYTIKDIEYIKRIIKQARATGKHRCANIIAQKCNIKHIEENPDYATLMTIGKGAKLKKLLKK